MVRQKTSECLCLTDNCLLCIPLAEVEPHIETDIIEESFEHLSVQAPEKS